MSRVPGNYGFHTPSFVSKMSTSGVPSVTLAYHRKSGISGIRLKIAMCSDLMNRPVRTHMPGDGGRAGPYVIGLME